MNQTFTDKDKGLPRYYRIGNLTLDVASKSLTRANGELISIAGKNYLLLEALAKASPNNLSVDQIHACVWKNTKVSDDTVRQRIKLLRQAIGVNSADEAYIQVAHGEGYSVKAHPIEEHQSLHKMTYRRLTLVTAAVIIVASILAISFLRQDELVVSVKSFTPTEQEDNLLANGFTEELIDKLIPIEGLTVTQYSAVQPRRTKAVIEGNIHKTEDQLSVSVRIVEAQTGEYLWNKKYEEKLPSDIYDVQANIAAHVALILKVTFDDDIYNEIAQGPTANIDAYYDYVRGLGLENAGKKDQAKLAFQSALLADPGFKLAKEALVKLNKI